MLSESNPCKDCGICCKYVTVPLDVPDEPSDIEILLWYVCHNNVTVWVPEPDDWQAHFATSCKHLRDDNTCGNYENRMEICSEFSASHCEKTLGCSDGVTLHNEEEVLAYFKERKPKLYARWSKFKATLKKKRGGAK